MRRTRRAETDVSKTLLKWLGSNLGRSSLAALTGTDWRALGAAAHILECYAYSDDLKLLEAFRIVVSRMQGGTQYFAYHAIAHVKDWHDRDRVWVLAGLPALGRIPRCRGDRWAWTLDEWEQLHAAEES